MCRLHSESDIGQDKLLELPQRNFSEETQVTKGQELVFYVTSTPFELLPEDSWV